MSDVEIEHEAGRTCPTCHIFHFYRLVVSKSSANYMRPMATCTNLETVTGVQCSMFKLAAADHVKNDLAKANIKKRGIFLASPKTTLVISYLSLYKQIRSLDPELGFRSLGYGILRQSLLMIIQIVVVDISRYMSPRKNGGRREWKDVGHEKLVARDEAVIVRRSHDVRRRVRTVASVIRLENGTTREGLLATKDEFTNFYELKRALAWPKRGIREYMIRSGDSGRDPNICQDQEEMEEDQEQEEEQEEMVEQEDDPRSTLSQRGCTRRRLKVVSIATPTPTARGDAEEDGAQQVMDLRMDAPCAIARGPPTGINDAASVRSVSVSTSRDRLWTGERPRLQPVLDKDRLRSTVDTKSRVGQPVAVAGPSKFGRRNWTQPDL
ncbi:hypothetical protein BDZ89DRAFT_1046137 [Hymenopellis radicata]|nr:hypothetical protein BDZ89DRAFT_1046137 [Hymenopellis radicata]